MNPSIPARFSKLGVSLPRILLPNPEVDLFKWSVIACDQHTSEPDYWEEVESIVGDEPSTLRVVFPEVYLAAVGANERIAAIKQTMGDYLSSDILHEREPGMMLTVRGTPHVSERKGLMVALDLDQYDYNPDATTLIRATEETIVDRIPPRVKVRAGAPIELPHVLVLIDDPEDQVFGGISRTELQRVYATQLMLGGGSVAGYALREIDHVHVASAFESLLARATGERPFLFAVGDGNHSLATAKAVWEKIKNDGAAIDHPARFALVEVVNLYDPGLRFEPIHRLIKLKGSPTGGIVTLVHQFATRMGYHVERRTQKEVQSALDNGGVIGYVSGDECGIIDVSSSNELPVAALQGVLNEELGLEVDYIHGWDTSVQLGSRHGSAALLLPDFDPHQLFPTVRKRGVLPRKAFSLGDAEEKRYYLEARRISDDR